MTLRRFGRAAAAIAVTLAAWVAIRLVFPSLDYHPPERLVAQLERSWFALSGMRKPAMLLYAALALVWLAIFFASIQARWPGHRAEKGAMLGAALGMVWALGFLADWAFLGTTLHAELLNGALDLAALALGGVLLGWAIGSDAPAPERPTPQPWLAVVLIALGFTAVHAACATLLAAQPGLIPDLLLAPASELQFAVLLAIGAWAGGMYVMLRAGLPFSAPWARAAFFAFGVFGHSWAWFQLFFVIEFAGVLLTLLLLSAIGALGVFLGALGYERVARGR